MVKRTQQKYQKEFELGSHQTSERMGDPTHAVLVDGWFYVSANVGWSKVDDDTGKMKDGAAFTPPVLLHFSSHAAHAAK